MRAVMRELARRAGAHGPWLAVGVAVATAIAVVDAALGASAVLIGLLIVPSLLVCTRLAPRPTGAVAIYTVVLAIALGVPDDFFGTVDHLVRVLVVAAGGLLAVWLAAIRHSAERARRRSQLVAEAGTTLDRELDHRKSLARLARLCVPAIADWCIVDMAAGDGSIERLAVIGADPARQRLARELDDLYPYAPDAEEGVAKVMRTGRSELIPTVPDELLRAVVRDDEHLRIIRSFGFRSGMMVPLVARGRTLGVLTFATAESRRRYGPDDLVLAEELASRCALAADNARLYAEAREAERRASEALALLDTLFESAPVGLGYWDRDLRYVRVNDALAELNGVPVEDHIGRTLREVLPGLDPEVEASFRRVLETGQPIRDAEASGETPAAPGRLRRWLASYYPVRDANGSTLGVGAVIVDITERVAAEEELRRQKNLYETLLEAQSDVGEAFVIVDDERVVFANGAFEAMTGYDLASLQALPSFLDLVDPSQRASLAAWLSGGATSTPEAALLEVAVRHRSGDRTDVEFAGIPLSGAEGVRLVLVGRDVSERKRAERERLQLLANERDARGRAEAAERRARFLADASALLDASLDLATTLNNLAQLSVPYIGDWCAVDVRDQAGDIRRVAVAHADATKRQLAGRLRAEYPPQPDARYGTAEVLRTGAAALYREVPDQLLRGMAEDESHLALLRELGYRSAMFVPMVARGRTLGVLGFFLAEGDRRFGADDLALAEELGGRAAVAVDNARLYGERSYIARTLQESLLPPELPDVPGVELGARFRAAGEGNEVGGDFYDVFDTGEAGWALVIGDVCGKGADAAAVTALIRYTLRATAASAGRPARALRQLNEAILRQRSDRRFASVALARLRVQDGGGQLALASGGHPLPLVLRGDGRVEEIGTPGTVLGVVPDPQLTDHTVALEPGDAVVLYTDGLTEAAAPERLLALQELTDILQRCAGLSAAEIAERLEDAVVDELGGSPPRDDIAILVMRMADVPAPVIDPADAHARPAPARPDAARDGDA